MTLSLTMALTPSAKSARNGRSKQTAAAKIGIHRKNFIGLADGNNNLRRVKRGNRLAVRLFQVSPCLADDSNAMKTKSFSERWRPFLFN
jgi:hypothetical protein